MNTTHHTIHPVPAATPRRRAPRRPAASASVAAAHGWAFTDSRAVTGDMALAAGYTRRMVNRLVRLSNPTIQDWFIAIADLDFSLIDHVVLELAAIVQCAGDHDASWWDEDHLAGTELELMDKWGMTDEDALDTITWLYLYNWYSVDTVLLRRDALVREPDLSELYLSLAAAATAIRHAGRRRDWYTRCHRCPKRAHVS